MAARARNAMIPMCRMRACECVSVNVAASCGSASRRLSTLEENTPTQLKIPYNQKTSASDGRIKRFNDIDKTLGVLGDLMKNAPRGTRRS